MKTRSPFPKRPCSYADCTPGSASLRRRNHRLAGSTLQICGARPKCRRHRGGCEMSAGVSVVACDQIALGSRHHELKRLLDFGADAPTDPRPYAGDEARIGQHEVASAFPVRIKTFDRLSVAILHEAGFLAAVALKNVDQMSAKVGFEDPRQKKNGRGRRRSESLSWCWQAFKQAERSIATGQGHDVHDAEHRVEDHPAAFWSGPEGGRPAFGPLEEACGGKSLCQFDGRSRPGIAAKKDALPLSTECRLSSSARSASSAAGISAEGRTAITAYLPGEESKAGP